MCGEMHLVHVIVHVVLSFSTLSLSFSLSVSLIFLSLCLSDLFPLSLALSVSLLFLSLAFSVPLIFLSRSLSLEDRQRPTPAYTASGRTPGITPATLRHMSYVGHSATGSHTMSLFISSKKSTFPQNRQLDIVFSNSKP